MPNYKVNSRFTYGFTLIELLITLAIIGILISVVYPSYMQHILKTHRSDALATLTQDQLILEKCYAQNFSYSDDCAVFPHKSVQGFYTIHLSNVTASTYTLTATPIGSQAKDALCSSISVNQANIKIANSETCLGAT